MSGEANPRQRLRPWLFGQLDNRTIPGLIWLPNEKGVIDRTKFRIPWKHGGKHDWTPDQSRVFKEWAIHTGKYREGVDEETFAKWKTNLRCALNKASDIREIAEESQKEAENPFKVYRFLPKKGKTEHRVHKGYYAQGEIISNGAVGRPDLPAHIENYSSSGSSMSSRSMQSGSSRVLNGQKAGGAMPQNAHSDYQPLPVDLEDLRSDSLRRVTEGMTSLDAKNYLKEEDMECEDVNSQSSDVAPARVSPFQSQAMFREVHIKQERLDNSSPCNQPELIYTNGLHNAVAMQQQPMFDLLDMADPNLPVTTNHQAGSAFYMTGPASVAGTSECSDNSQAPFMTANTAPSPAFSNAASPQQPYGPFASPAPSPTQHFAVVTTRTCSPPQPYYTTSPAPSPAHGFTTTSQAPSPQQPFSSPALSPQQEAQFAGSAHVVPAGDVAVQGAEGACGAGFVNQMAGLDMADSAAPTTHTLLQHFALPTVHYDPDVDIGHECIHTPDESAMKVKVLYLTKEVVCEHVTGPEGCLIAYHPIGEQRSRMLDEVGLCVIKEKVYDQKPGRKEIALPEWQNVGREHLNREVNNLLQNAGRGVVIECSNGDIYAKRLCKTSVYYATHFNNEKCEKLNRDENAQQRVKIFDCQNVFEPALERFAYEAHCNGKNEVKHPNPEVFLFIGQNGTPSNAHLRFVVVKITSCKASRLLKTMERNVYSITGEVSKSDSYDRLDETVRTQLVDTPIS